jgi:flagella basal body P-ring formation protein FlgA
VVALGALVAVAVVSRAARAQDAIALRPVARVQASAPVYLRDVAELVGPGAQALGGTELAGVARRPASVTLEDVRRVLESAGANLGHVRLSGGVCEVRGPVEVAPARPDVAGADRGAQTPPREGTVRAAVAARVADLLGVEPARLRLTWQEADAALLDTTVAGRVVTLDPAGAGDRIPVAVRVYEGERTVSAGTVRVGIEVLHGVLVATGPLSRGATLSAEGLVREARWLAPSVDPADESAVGQVTRSRLEAGAVVRRGDIEPPVLLKRGDLVIVDCLVGGVVVRASARAAEPGRDGQVITVQTLHSKRTLRARVDGPGRAVLVSAEPVGRGEQP